MRVPRVLPVELDRVPVGPVGPVGPVDPVDPVDPVVPVVPVDPTDPVVALSTEHLAVELQAPDDAFQPL